MIPLSEMVNRGVYVCRGRNFSLGVWDAEAKSFIGRRHKFNWFLTHELHHDSDPHHGTVQPLERIGLLPEQIPLEDGVRINFALFGYLSMYDDVAQAKLKRQWEKDREAWKKEHADVALPPE